MGERPRGRQFMVRGLVCRSIGGRCSFRRRDHGREIALAFAQEGAAACSPAPVAPDGREPQGAELPMVGTLEAMAITGMARDLATALQAAQTLCSDFTLDRLLETLQDGAFERLGSVQTISVDVRVIAATDRPLVQQVAAGLFREDLYYRLNVFTVTLPPLRQQREDIPLLVWYFVAKCQAKLGKPIERIPERAMAMLVGYHWPGNIRELANVIEPAMILSHESDYRIDVI